MQDEKPVRIRLANIDAPEKKQAFGRRSTNQLKGLVVAQPVTVTYTQTDRYGRIIGHVFTTNGIEANRWMVQSGAAWVYDATTRIRHYRLCNRRRSNKSAACGLTVNQYRRGYGGTKTTDAFRLSNPSTAAKQVCDSFTVNYQRSVL